MKTGTAIIVSVLFGFVVYLLLIVQAYINSTMHVVTESYWVKCHWIAACFGVLTVVSTSLKWKREKRA